MITLCRIKSDEIHWMIKLTNVYFPDFFVLIVFLCWSLFYYLEPKKMCIWVCDIIIIVLIQYSTAQPYFFPFEGDDGIKIKISWISNKFFRNRLSGISQWTSHQSTDRGYDVAKQHWNLGVNKSSNLLVYF